MTKNAKARNGATGVKAPEVKENNVDPALVKEIDKELGVLAERNSSPARANSRVWIGRWNASRKAAA